MLTRSDVFVRPPTSRIATFLAVSIMALAVAFPSEGAMAPGSGIVGSKHDFTASDGRSTCTVCHVSGRGGKADPLWGKWTGGSYGWATTRYTYAGTRLPTAGASVGGPSAMCLSCHDGMVAKADRQLGVVTGAPSIGRSGGTVALGGTLDGNHPVSVPYPASGIQNVYRGLVTGRQLSGDHYVSDPTRRGIVLYRDNGDGTVSVARGKALGGNYGIECSSCHDVHNGPAVKDEHLVRGRLAGSGPEYLCMKCHSL